MSDLEKAARMALLALEYYQHRKIEWDYSDDAAITALRQALEQPAKQEPVDWEAVAADQAMTIAMMKAERKPWVGLTQQDIDIAFDDTQEGGGFDDFARAIEAKLKEKNNG